MEYEYVGDELNVFALATNWKKYFSTLVRPYVHGDVLEVGAGIGETTRALINEECTRWVCAEPDQRFTKLLGALQLPVGPKPEVLTGDISAVPESSKFDCIVYIDVLEHIREDREELRRAVARLAPNGFLVVLSPAFQSLYSEFDRSIGHERRYTRATLDAAFPAEVRRVKTFYADAVGAILSFTNALLLKQSLPTRKQILFWDRVVVPISRVVDPVLGRGFGRSVISIHQRSGL